MSSVVAAELRSVTKGGVAGEEKCMRAGGLGVGAKNRVTTTIPAERQVVGNHHKDIGPMASWSSKSSSKSIQKSCLDSDKYLSQGRAGGDATERPWEF